MTEEGAFDWRKIAPYPPKNLQGNLNIISCKDLKKGTWWFTGFLFL